MSAGDSADQGEGTADQSEDSADQSEGTVDRNEGTVDRNEGTADRGKRAAAVGGYAGLLLALLAAVAWLTGRPFVFPSLGPSAYALATDGEGTLGAREVIGGHAVGVVAGLAAYHALAPGLSLVSVPPAGSSGALRLAAAGTLAVALTATGMEATRTQHAPAAATTLIVALGLLATPADGGLILVAVTLLYVADMLVDHGPADRA